MKTYQSTISPRAQTLRKSNYSAHETHKIHEIHERKPAKKECVQYLMHLYAMDAVAHVNQQPQKN